MSALVFLSNLPTPHIGLKSHIDDSSPSNDELLLNTDGYQPRY